LARFGTAWALPRVTMDQSDSQLSVSRLSLSLSLPSRLAPVVCAAGVGWASHVPSNAFGTCHAPRPRQVSGNLTIPVSSVLGSDDATASPPACFSVVSRLDCFRGCDSRLRPVSVPVYASRRSFGLRPFCSGALACPGSRQHSGWGGRSICAKSKSTALGYSNSSRLQPPMVDNFDENRLYNTENFSFPQRYQILAPPVFIATPPGHAERVWQGSPWTCRTRMPSERPKRLVRAGKSGWQRSGPRYFCR